MEEKKIDKYIIKDEAIRALLVAFDDLPTKYGRKLQDYLRENVEPYKSEGEKLEKEMNDFIEKKK